MTSSPMRSEEDAIGTPEGPSNRLRAGHVHVGERACISLVVLMMTVCAGVVWRWGGPRGPAAALLVGLRVYYPGRPRRASLQASGETVVQIWTKPVAFGGAVITVTQLSSHSSMQSALTTTPMVTAASCMPRVCGDQVCIHMRNQVNVTYTSTSPVTDCTCMEMSNWAFAGMVK